MRSLGILRQRICDGLFGLLIPVAIIVLWEIATRCGLFPEQLLVPPRRVVFAFIDLIKDGSLTANLKISLIRVTEGFLAGSSVGLLVGTLMGLSKNVERYAGPFLHALRQVPLFGWMPFLILLFGIDEVFKVVFVAIGAFYPMVLNTFEGIKNVPKEYVEVGRVFEYGQAKLLRKVIFPAALPSIFTGIKFSLGISWMLVVGAEFVGASSGIGYLMTWGRLLLQFDIVFVGVIVIGAVGLTMNYVIRRIETVYLPGVRH